MYPKLLTLLILFTSLSAFAAKPTPTPAEIKEPSPDGEAVDVSKVTEKYWAQGKDTELGVVQNRKYTSEHRLELDVYAGSVSTNPFLSVHSYGVSLGYYFNQYFSAHVMGWKDSVSTSSAYDAFKAQTPSGTEVALNRPKSFYGLELNENFLYGKASLFGSTIIYVDIYALGGAGLTNTDTGKYFTPFIGLGQKIHLNQYMALKLDYRAMFFSETIPAVGSNAAHSGVSNTTDVISLGLCFFY